MKVKILSKFSYQTYPITDDMIEVNEKLLQEIGNSKQFDENGNIIDYKPTIQKPSYKDLIISKIRRKYSIDDEIALINNKDTKPNDYAEYQAYREQCKREARIEVDSYGN